MILHFNVLRGSLFQFGCQIRNIRHFSTETQCFSVLSCLCREITQNPSFFRMILHFDGFELTQFGGQVWNLREKIARVPTYLSLLTNYACVQWNVIQMKSAHANWTAFGTGLLNHDVRITVSYSMHSDTWPGKFVSFRLLCILKNDIPLYSVSNYVRRDMLVSFSFVSLQYFMLLVYLRLRRI